MLRSPLTLANRYDTTHFNSRHANLKLSSNLACATYFGQGLECGRWPRVRTGLIRMFITGKELP
jgi:hypothetical protein